MQICKTNEHEYVGFMFEQKKKKKRNGISFNKNCEIHVKVQQIDWNIDNLKLSPLIHFQVQTDYVYLLTLFP